MIENAPSTVMPVASPSQTRHARGMFFAALLWLGYVSIILHFHERPQDAYVFWAAVAGLAVLTPLFWVEAWFAARRQARGIGPYLVQALLPILRLGRRDDEQQKFLWLPGFGWQEVDARLEKQLSRALSGPMIGIAVLVLPVVLVEILLAPRLESDLFLARVTQFATALIWWSFTIEFVLMVSITPKRIKYCKEHWLDLAVILLPFLFFFRALRLGQVLRLQNLGKTARVYKLRGVAMRTYRALLVFEFVRRLAFGSPQKRLARLKQKLEEHEEQLTALRQEIALLETEIALAGDSSEPSVLIEQTS